MMSMNKIPENEQWKLIGDCDKCRRKNYCKTKCTINKKRTKAYVRDLVYDAMNIVTDGVYGRIMDGSVYNVEK